MTRRRAIRLSGALVSALVWSLTAGGVASANTNLVRNGSFEKPALTGETTRPFAVGQHIGAWTVTAGSVFTSTGFPGFVTVPLGTQVMGLRALPVPSPGDGEICQTVSGMVVNAVYKIRFLAASVLQPSRIDVTFGGIALGHLHLQGSLPAEFVVFERRVTAVATSGSLCLHGHTLDDGAIPMVDAVRIKPSD